MKNSAGYFADLTEAVGNGWNRFWFTPADPLPLSFLRIAVGALVVMHLLALGADFGRWFPADGLLPPDAVKKVVLVEELDEPYHHYSYFNHLTGSQARFAHYAAIGLAIAFLLGLFTRVTGVLTVIALLSYVHRLPLLAGHADPLLVFLVAYLCIGPAAAYWSLDRWIATLRGANPTKNEAPSLAAALSIRFIQVHLAAFVAMLAAAKMYGDAWWDGEAIWFLIAQTHSRPVDLSALHNWHYLINFWTHLVAYFELAFPILIWNRQARPLLIGLGAAIWLSLIPVTGLLVFSLTLVVASLAFVPASTFRSLLSRPAGSPVTGGMPAAA
ncbi:MAG: hypothetical protein SFU86_00765 [Pirellulaceae bacterium]|nr:hypothetical protein [Pirellulaceae bacterium]